jgi:hypothetical protein
MRALQALVVVVVAAAVWMCFDNVFSNNTPVRELGERAACARKKCELHHAVTREARSPWSQTFDFSWSDETIRVTCRRAYYVVGDRHCTAD